MNIYIVAKEKINNTNYFVDELVNILNKAGHNVTLGLDILWSENVFLFDIVYFQWPEYIIERNITNSYVIKIQERIAKIKEKGIKIFSHCHNLKPHIIDNPNKLTLYNIVYGNCDVMIHMGKFSKKLMEEKYPKVKHYILPHHIYNSFEFNKDKKKCRKELKLPLNKINILCFGQFRTEEERNFILNLIRILPNEKYNFITPSFYRERLKQNTLAKSIKVCFKTIYYKMKRIKFSRKLINDEITEKLFCATDIVLIQRPDILNSGNLPMGFKAGKIVIGPNIGNVGIILKETNNPTFQPRNIKSTISAIRSVLDMDIEEKGNANKKYALKHWNHEQIGYEFNEIIKNLYC